MVERLYIQCYYSKMASKIPMSIDSARKKVVLVECADKKRRIKNPNSKVRYKKKIQKSENEDEVQEDGSAKSYSGYSTSEEDSDYEIIDKNVEFSKDKLDTVTMGIRKRVFEESRSTPHRNEGSTIPEIGDNKMNISDMQENKLTTTKMREDEMNISEMLDDKLNMTESDISLETEEESDAFWKTLDTKKADDLTKLIKRKKKVHSDQKFSWFRSLKSIWSEWQTFKNNNIDEVRYIKHARNDCILGLLIVTIFCGIGGIIFRHTEGAFEIFYKCGVKRVKRDFLDTLWDKRYIREDEWKSLARTKLKDFENQLYDAYESGLNSYSGQKNWSFLNSIIYVITVVTTIGYGHLSPTTTIGRIVTIIYSLFGIPLFLILLADYGKLFTRAIKFVWAFVRRLYYTGSCRKVRRTGPVHEVMKGVQMVYDMAKRRSSKDPTSNIDITATISPSATPALSSYTIDDEFNLPISVAFSILIMYMICGAFFFSYTEDWDLFTAFYFVYISISTIGFGDMVPRSQVFSLLISLVYLIFGLALTSMCINVIQEKLSDSFKHATAKIGATIGFEIPSEGGNIHVLPYGDSTSEQVTTCPDPVQQS